jgi:predicted nucleic acid-binding protein
MAYFIKPLPIKPENDKIYILDTNVWFYLINSSIKITPDEVQSRYIDFVYKLGKACLKSPKIKLPSFIVSELLNRYLRYFSMKNFALRQNQIDLMNKDPNDYYKKIYKKSEIYSTDYEIICENIKDFSTYYDFIDDEFSSILTKSTLHYINQGELDFIDYLIYKLAIKYKYTIITNDSDFYVEDVEILTLNSALLSKVSY